MDGSFRSTTAPDLPKVAVRKTIRAFLALTICATSALLTTRASAQIAADTEGRGGGTGLRGLVVKTDKGSIEGFESEGVAKFLGIPYAAPPVGNLRWRPPVDHAPWSGVLKASTFGPTCAQINELGVFAGPPNSNEDCLYINVFTPSLGPNEAGKKLPVMFWSHGGGDVDGESNDYDGSKLALQGKTVVVTFNYRLNLFGFLAHPALNNEGHLIANYGFLDNLFALRWVHDNIEKFGGDPGNVTVFGQSAGARNAAALVLSPLAKGLFEKAIFESGAWPVETPLSMAETMATNFAAAAGCGSGKGADVAACLRALPADKVEALAGNGIVYDSAGETGVSAYVTTDGLVTDGTIFPAPALDQIEQGNYNHVPLIIGNVLNEGEFGLAATEFYESPRKPLTEEQFTAYVQAVYTGNAGPAGSPPAFPAGTVAAVLAHYKRNFASPELQWGAVETDGGVNGCPTRHLLPIWAKEVPVYAYEFRDQTAPDYFPKMPGFVSLAYHTSDIQYYWPLYHGGNLGTPHPLNKRQEELSDQLVAAWTNFAWTGDPNGHGEHVWPRYTKVNPRLLAEDTNGLRTMTDAEFSAEHQCDFWDKLLVYKSTVK